ncbi:hypothetical protein [Candidatus Poriferisodalis sp.]|uniref:hypothetical protein n=1 Tax=Candidatus Poriferisodalis sp. TaxID=3101277 RepID=UPI003B01A840
MTTAATLATTTTEALWQPKPTNVLPLPWIDFHEAHQRRNATEEIGMLSEAMGALRVEDRCIYFGESVLSLPQGLVQYDDTAREFWLHQRVYVQGPFRTGSEVYTRNFRDLRTESPACGNRPIMTAESLELCEDRFHYSCDVAFYSRNHGVLPSEAQRRLDRVPEMEAILAAMHATEPRRTAGWGIDLADPWSMYTDEWGRCRSESGTYTEEPCDESFVAWLWLTGDELPGAAATAIAAAHDDVEIRLAAGTSYAALRAAQYRLSGHQGILRLRETIDTGGERQVEWAYEVAESLIDHRANRLSIHVDVQQNRPSDKRRYPGSDGKLSAHIISQLQDIVDVPISVSWEWAPSAS